MHYIEGLQGRNGIKLWFQAVGNTKNLIKRFLFYRNNNFSFISTLWIYIWQYFMFYVTLLAPTLIYSVVKRQKSSKLTFFFISLAEISPRIYIMLFNSIIRYLIKPLIFLAVNMRTILIHFFDLSLIKKFFQCQLSLYSNTA